MISFHNPLAFLAFLLVLLIFTLRKIGLFKRISFPAVLSDWGGQGFFWKGRGHKVLSVTAKLFYLLAFCAITLALADPVKVTKEKVYNSVASEIIFVMDTSPSMAAKDMDGTRRLDAAKNAISSIMQDEEGYGFGLVVFGSEASLAIPPTINHQHFYNKMGSLVLGNMGDGSAIGDGLSTAVYHLTSSTAQKKCIILLTDGENNAGKIHPETAAQLAAEYGIKLYVVGIGTKGTIPIEYTDPKTGLTKAGYLESNYNSAALRKIATTGGGKYYEVRTLDELKYSLENVTSQESVNQSFTYRNQETLLYKYFTLAALVLFLLAAFIRLVLLKGILVLRLDMKYKKRILIRYFCMFMAMISTLLAWSGLSWGTYLAPVQKNSTSVAMVFDISYSMLAKDCPQGMTRLRTAALYAKELLGRMEDTSVSVVIAKGDGMEIIPMTQDRAAVSSLLEVLSPSLMTLPGSSIGKGILKARNSIPENLSSAGRIWVFTDGEETDGSLAPALAECIKYGVPVTIIGFGQESESAVLAGDGITTVHTALRSENLQNIIKATGEKYKILGDRANAHYVLYSEKGSALKLLNQLKSSENENLITSYEVKPVPRYKFFLILTILFVSFSFILSEIKMPSRGSASKGAKTSKKRKLIFASLLAISSGFFTGCTSETFSVLKGSYAYHQEQYRSAVAAFKDAVERAKAEDNQMILDYALYNLGTTYAAMEESQAAEKYFAAISDQAPASLRFAACYNAGVLAHKNGNYEEAQENFRKALEIDSRNLDAKINLELSIQVSEDSARQNQSSAIQGSQDKSEKDDMEKSIFEHIKENDQKQWKNSEPNASQASANDF